MVFLVTLLQSKANIVKLPQKFLLYYINSPLLSANSDITITALQQNTYQRQSNCYHNLHVQLYFDELLPQPELLLKLFDSNYQSYSRHFQSMDHQYYRLIHQFFEHVDDLFYIVFFSLLFPHMYLLLFMFAVQ